MLVERRPRNTSSICDFFDGRGVEASLRKQLPHGCLDLLARRLRAVAATAAAVGARRHD